MLVAVFEDYYPLLIKWYTDSRFPPDSKPFVRHGKSFFPTFSKTATSTHYYPDSKPDAERKWEKCYVKSEQFRFCALPYHVLHPKPYFFHYFLQQLPKLAVAVWSCLAVALKPLPKNHKTLHRMKHTSMHNCGTRLLSCPCNCAEL